MFEHGGEEAEKSDTFEVNGALAVPKEIEEEPVVEKKGGAKEKRKRDPKARLFGIVTSIRKIQTKTGKLMVTANCDSTSFKFVITVFPKDYDRFVGSLSEGSVVMTEGSLKFNEQMNEISIMPDSIRNTTITSLRNQVQEMGLFDPDDKINYLEESDDVISAVEAIEKVEDPQPKESEFTISVER